MNCVKRMGLFISPLLALSLVGCFTVTVRHSSVSDGHLNGGPASYSQSPNSYIIVQQDKDADAPKVYLHLIADSDEELIGIRYSIEKYDEKANGYRNAGGGYKFAASNIDGTLVWAKHVELTEYGGTPIVLDLSGTSMVYPLRLTVVAVERDGNSKEINAKYFYWPASGPPFVTH